MRRVPIRMKLAAALAVPMVGLFLITTAEVVETTREVARVRSQTALARSALGPSGLITTLQNERTWAVVDLIGFQNDLQAPVVGYEETRRQTDQAIAAFRDTIADESQAVRDAYEPALANLAHLTELRTSIDDSPGPRNMSNLAFADEVYFDYAEAIGPFLDANGRVSVGVDDAELREATSLVSLTSLQVETTSDLARSAILSIIIGGGLNDPDEIASISTIRSAFDEANQELLDARPPFDEAIAANFPTEMTEGLTAQIDAAIAQEPVELDALLAPLNVPPDGGYMGLRADLVEALNARADDLNDQAAARERLYISMAVATLAAAVVLTWLVSRSITKPLRSLTRQAKSMAANRLPDAVMGILDTPLGEDIDVPQVRAVQVQTRDEVSDVADALNTVQDTALDLAVEQAVLRRNIADSFVNLGRRNQNLLGRQLDFITELENRETDPDALGNLFRLDHLATRMRRNAESLLVLAGVEPPRQWAAPVRLTDVIRAALGEVESYQRVTAEGMEPATILGSAAADLAHLLAELIENALVFSPPDRQVLVRGRRNPAGGYSLAIIDGGLGMAAADLAAANRRLAGAESFTIAPSKYLGHYVAGNLATRHEIRVQLQASRGSGVTAVIDVPPSLLTSAPATGAPLTPPDGQRALAIRRRTGDVPPAPALPSAGDRPPAPGGPAMPRGPGVPIGPAVPLGPPEVVRPATEVPPVSPMIRPFDRAPETPARPFDRPGEVSARPMGPAPARPMGRPADVPLGPGRSPGPPPGFRARPVDDDLLAALTRNAPPRVVPEPPGVASVPPPVPLADDQSPLAPPDALTRRVRGAQLPRTTVVSLRGDTPPDAPPAGSRGTFDPVPERAAEIRALLANFTAGVQRGLEEARRPLPAART
jgi:signal transduction histidine kinase